MDIENKNPTPVCFAYLREMVILSDGDVTTCCLDAKGMNTLGNVNKTPLDKLWEERFLPWHWKNVDANLRRVSWESSLCNMCLKLNCMSAFNATKTRDDRLIEDFHQRVHPFPSFLVIEPVSMCNYACCGCYAGLGELKRRAFLDMVNFNHHVLPVIPNVRQVRLYNYGEPFLHPHIIDMIGSIRREGPTLSLHISTNGQLMTEEIAEILVDAQVNYLIVSVHGGPTQEGLLKYSRRGPDINVIASNIDHLVKLKKRKGKRLPWIFLKAILFNWNDSAEDMEAFLKLGKTLGVDFTGWGINASDLTFSSKRVASGTQPYQYLVENKLLESNFYELPAWPPETGICIR